MKVIHLSNSNGGSAGIAAYRIHKSLTEIGLNSEMWVNVSINKDNSVKSSKNKVRKFLTFIRRNSKKPLMLFLKTKNPDEYKKIFRKIIKIDLEAVVNVADYLIVNWDESVFKGGGTHGEITMAYWLNKPVYLVNSLPINDVSSWVFSCSE